MTTLAELLPCMGPGQRGGVPHGQVTLLMVGVVGVLLQSK